MGTYLIDEKLLCCDNEIFYCSSTSLLWENFNGLDQRCDYISPENIASRYTYVGVLADGYPAYTNESNTTTGMLMKNDLCWGCPAYAPFFGASICYDNKDLAWCEWRKHKENKNTEWKTDHCNCLDDGMEWSTEQHDCVKSGKGGKTSGKTGSSGGKTGSGSGKTGEKTGNKTGTNTGKVNKTCAEKYPGNAEAIACCEFGKNGGAEWKDNKCNCAGENKKWEYSDNIKAGHCVDDKKTEKKPEVKNNNIDCVIELGASVKCKNGTRFDKTASVSVSSEKCNLYKSNVAKYLNEIAGLLCADAGGVGNVTTDAELQSAIEDLNRFFEYTKSNANVWKNADGKFNTARLVSDATAGVILGTVGGIVSAKIIKKKQVEKGFDALNCTIGGQKVADWGDEFTVGFGK